MGLGAMRGMVCVAGLLLAPAMMTAQTAAPATPPAEASPAKSAPAAGPTASATAKPVSITLLVTPHSGTAYPKMRPDAYIVVHLSGADAIVGSAIQKAVKEGWKCLDKASYAVTAQVADATGKLTPGKGVPIDGVVQLGKGSCTDAAPEPVELMLNASVDTTTQYVVSLVGLPDGMKAASAAVKFPVATLPSFSVLPSGVPGEAMTDGTKHDVGQLAVTYSMPSVKNSPVFLSSTDLFSTDEKDTKSAFAATGGVGMGLSKSHYIPVQLSETVQGNQVATALSAVSNASVLGLVPWYGTRKALNNGVIDWGRSPEWTLTGSYTHRFDQVATAKTKPLAVNDSAINPALTVEPFYLLPKACAAWRKKIAATNAPGSRQYCIGIQMDLGMWYLPQDHTKTGSQRVEGYGDATILIPLTNMNFKDFPAMKADNLLNSQIQIEYSDAVNAANNYARTRVWTFGIAVMK